MPKGDFLDAVSKSTELTDAEKRIIKRDISADVYTHCGLVKYKRSRKLCMEIHQFYPRKVVGKDSDGHTVVEGACGCRAVYEYVGGQWQLPLVTMYD